MASPSWTSASSGHPASVNGDSDQNMVVLRRPRHRLTPSMAGRPSCTNGRMVGIPSRDEPGGRRLLLSPGAFGTAGYRFVATWRRRRGGYVALVLLIGLVGGLASGSIAAARRTASSFSAFLVSTNPSDLTIVPAGRFVGLFRVP